MQKSILKMHNFFFEKENFSAMEKITIGMEWKLDFYPEVISLNTIRINIGTFHWLCSKNISEIKILNYNEFINNMKCYTKSIR